MSGGRSDIAGIKFVSLFLGVTFPPVRGLKFLLCIIAVVNITWR